MVIDDIVDSAVAEISWTDNNGDPVLSDVIQFGPLLSSHGGQYTCRASISVPAISAVKKGSATRAVIVQGNFSREIDNVH